jgi:hypothetical protein
MKKQLSLFIWAVAVFGMSPVWAAANSGSYGASSADLTGAPGTRTKTNVNYEKYETRSSTKNYAAKDGNNIYYTQPAKRGDMYKEYSGKSSVRTNRSETLRAELKRKYYLAHPFFQPLKGKFGSVTDASYTEGSYGFSISLAPSGPVLSLSDSEAKWKMSQFSVKEDISFGITDRLAVIGMVEFDSSKYKADWKNPITTDDKTSDSGINLYGLGLQWRFADTKEWIATLSGSYQRQVDAAHIGVIDLRAGYKIESSTIYGLARGWLVGFEGDVYGNLMEGGGSGVFLAYGVGNKTYTYFEGGLGLFSVLDPDWTLNLEGVFGSYDWHNQASLKAAIGWQPASSFALNLYGKMVVYDSMDGKNLDTYFKDSSQGLNNYTYSGTAKIDDYSEWSAGLQAVLYF